MISRLRDMLRALFFRRRFEADMTEEFRFHLEQVTEDLVRRGVPRAEAERRARASFGSIEGARDEAREARGIRWADELRGDLRYALRTLRFSLRNDPGKSTGGSAGPGGACFAGPRAPASVRRHDIGLAMMQCGMASSECVMPPQPVHVNDIGVGHESVERAAGRPVGEPFEAIQRQPDEIGKGPLGALAEGGVLVAIASPRWRWRVTRGTETAMPP